MERLRLPEVLYDGGAAHRTAQGVLGDRDGAITIQ
jgi:hypothetical protein